MHVFGTERVSGDACDEGRVDAARQPDHHVGEAVLADVVVRATDQRRVDLGFAVGDRGDDRQRVVSRGCRCLAERDLRQGVALEPAPWIERALAVHGIDVEVDHGDSFGELGRTRDQRPVRVEDQ